MFALEAHSKRLPLRPICTALGLNRSTLYSRLRPREKTYSTERLNAPQPRALSPDEKEHVFNTLNSAEYADQPPAQVYQSLLEQGSYLCSVSTMHRLLKSKALNGERRAQREPKSHCAPRLKASRPNEVWTWDITKLPTERSGEYLSLYVVMDLYSRFIVAWMLSEKENSALAQQLMREAHEKYEISTALTIHQDRGSPMTAHAYLDLLGELAITASHSRPRVSNDNPYSESQFRTMKYQPDYPRKFQDYGHARCWCEEYVQWYNFSHHHSGLAGFTPEQVFTGRFNDVAAIKQKALDEQYILHPERFVKGKPILAMPEDIVYINPVILEDGEIDQEVAVNFPTLTRAKLT